jgi:hypothetical protein
MRRKVSTFLAFLATLPAAAVAQEPFAAGQVRSTALAFRVWGHETCPYVSITPFQPLKPGEADKVLGRTWTSGCKIELNTTLIAHEASFQSSSRGGRYDLLVETCSVIVHEMGHAQGYYDEVGYKGDHFHSPDPKSVMYPIQVTTYAPFMSGAMDGSCWPQASCGRSRGPRGPQR